MLILFRQPLRQPQGARSRHLLRTSRVQVVNKPLISKAPAPTPKPPPAPNPFVPPQPKCAKAATEAYAEANSKASSVNQSNDATPSREERERIKEEVKARLKEKEKEMQRQWKERVNATGCASSAGPTAARHKNQIFREKGENRLCTRCRSSA